MVSTSPEQLAHLLSLVRELQADSTHQDAPAFDAGAWLAQWVQQPIEALGGRTPAQVLVEPDGMRVVSRLLGAQRSGAYL